MAGDGMEIVELDIRGQICPSTLLIALRELNRCRNKLKAGETTLRLLIDNRDATGTIPEAARNMGYRVEIGKEPEAYVVTISAGA